MVRTAHPTSRYTMTADYDNSQQLQEHVRDAIASATPLRIQGGNSKYFYGNQMVGATLDVSTHRGIVNYEPSELVITVRAGTTLREIESVLAAQNQMLAFEPPGFGEHATIGGTIACNFSGPRRPYAGAARDFVLGCKIINGKAELLNFGGQVMKNVAGYDASRLMAGAMGTLGVILELSLKVLPRPEAEVTLCRASSVAESLQSIHQWQRLPLPISACCFDENKMYVRLSGTAAALKSACATLKCDVVADEHYWRNLREHKLAFFQGVENLWRISLPSNTPPLNLAGEWFYDWAGAQRWLKTAVAAAEIRRVVAAAGGHATLFRSNNDAARFQPLATGVMKLHQNLKLAFDPQRIFNRGRMYQEI